MPPKSPPRISSQVGLISRQTNMSNKRLSQDGLLEPAGSKRLSFSERMGSQHAAASQAKLNSQRSPDSQIGLHRSNALRRKRGSDSLLPDNTSAKRPRFNGDPAMEPHMGKARAPWAMFGDYLKRTDPNPSRSLLDTRIQEHAVRRYAPLRPLRTHAHEQSVPNSQGITVHATVTKTVRSSRPTVVQQGNVHPAPSVANIGYSSSQDNPERGVTGFSELPPRPAFLPRAMFVPTPPPNRPLPPLPASIRPPRTHYGPQQSRVRPRPQVTPLEPLTRPKRRTSPPPPPTRPAPPPPVPPFPPSPQTPDARPVPLVWGTLPPITPGSPFSRGLNAELARLAAARAADRRQE
ncbi:hypothetical protein GGR53DRAFT_364714 [Hypoxylon sp. FL1150]|nr:hypothetical protein GGR53DRAFT_364714 [Hypoxylon sp. FL1150]